MNPDRRRFIPVFCSFLSPCIVRLVRVDSSISDAPSSEDTMSRSRIGSGGRSVLALVGSIVRRGGREGRQFAYALTSGAEGSFAYVRTGARLEVPSKGSGRVVRSTGGAVRWNPYGDCSGREHGVSARTRVVRCHAVHVRGPGHSHTRRRGQHCVREFLAMKLRIINFRLILGGLNFDHIGRPRAVRTKVSDFGCTRHPPRTNKIRVHVC